MALARAAHCGAEQRRPSCRPAPITSPWAPVSDAYCRTWTSPEHPGAPSSFICPERAPPRLHAALSPSPSPAPTARDDSTYTYIYTCMYLPAAPVHASAVSHHLYHLPSPTAVPLGLTCLVARTSNSIQSAPNGAPPLGARLPGCSALDCRIQSQKRPSPYYPNLSPSGSSEAGLLLLAHSSLSRLSHHSLHPPLLCMSLCF
jgi:hypothetical protein